MQPIAITGSSVFSPLGTDPDGFWQGLCHPADLQTPWPLRELAPYPVNNVIAIPEETWGALNNMDGKARSERVTSSLVRSALEAAKLNRDGVGTIGCALGTTTRSAEFCETAFLEEDGSNDVAETPRSDLVPRGNLDWSGPTFTLSTACSSGLLAPALSAQIVASGECDFMIAGGVDVLLEYTICGFNSLRVASRDRCRPFSEERKGVILSEGGACFCLETVDRAEARKADIQAVILGYGTSCDGGSPTAPDVEGIARAIKAALGSANLQPDDIAAIIAHGTGTPTNDKVEVEALRRVFATTELPPITSVKGAIGHAQGGAGALALFTALSSLKHGKLPGVANLETVDPALAPITVSRETLDLSSGCLMVNAFGFGGNNCVMIVASHDYLKRRRH
ncbi:beta-ketoacyl synthase N-terminal-like domain-containing protein [Breoghania sp.]|uniref:beta-ketoacyl synthase N-terminal-like domain-containing protein n=1 Tax=Breoghania sp. TaxID=2065378 RepID=UPI002AA905AA|nr:beta-ketoacyl synthase N-terminal-like domain-containing protein [Breoghania sp.]